MKKILLPNPTHQPSPTKEKNLDTLAAFWLTSSAARIYFAYRYSFQVIFYKHYGSFNTYPLNN
jgi:hypothetical protein